MLASHARHALLFDAPSVLEYVPAEHAVHTIAETAPTAVEYVPFTHSVHTTLPAASLNFPAKHFVHGPPSGPDAPALHVQLVADELPKRELESVGHVEHADSAVASSTDENLPAPQSRQAFAPASDLYLPAPQLVHVCPEPVNPLSHMQAVEPTDEMELVGHAEQVVSEVAPIACEYLDAPQSEHVSVPATALYFPATHVVHVPPSGPEEPTLHWQAVALLLPPGALEFGGHGRQFVDADADE